MIEKIKETAAFIKERFPIIPETAIILGTGFMNFALARIATLDIIVAFFVLLMFALMFGFVKALEKGKSLKIQFLWLFLCGLAMGVAISVKWTGVKSEYTFII